MIMGIMMPRTMMTLEKMMLKSSTIKIMERMTRNKTKLKIMKLKKDDPENDADGNHVAEKKRYSK